MTIEAIIGEAIRLGMASGLGLPFAIGLVLVMAVLIVGVRSVGWRFPRLPGDPTSTDSRDDSTPATDRPPAQWGQNDGPPGGGMEGG